MADSAASLFAPHRLRCEYEATPLGTDEQHPRFSWLIHDPTTSRGEAQTAYQILVACDTAGLAADRGDVWDSGRVESEQSVFVPYDGPALRSRRRYHWKVRFWNAAGRPSQWSAPQWWEMGLLDENECSAKWIASHLVGGKDSGAAAPYLRKGFELKGPPERARLYITALGLYEASLNGRRLGDLVFTPGWTDYHKRVMVQTYDVTDCLSPGRNVLGVVLGDGWYCGHVGPLRRQVYGDRPKLMAQLEVEYEDGLHDTIVTDGSWRTSSGPILSNDLLMGETYDARFEMPGWDTPAFDDSSWQTVNVSGDVRVTRVASVGPRVRRIETVRPVAVTEPTPGRYVFDFGQNLVGRVRVCLRGAAGETVQLRHGEMLNSDGTLYTANLRRALATDHYTFATDGEMTWEPLFTFHGFRYLELSGTRGVTWDPAAMKMSNAPGLSAVEALVLHSDMPVSGAFECSHPLVNRLQSNIVWGQRGNFLEVPTDCPQRDERLGWTGDIQVFLATACFNMDVQGFMAKWLIDLADAQQESGAYPTVAPGVLGSSMSGTAAWADAGIICPWIIYQRYGDVRVLERHYGAMVRFLEYLCKQAGDACIRTGGFGDWLSVGAFTPVNVIGTAYFAHSADLLSRIAAVLKKEADSVRFAALFARISEAFCREFVTPTGRIIGDSQTAYVLALRFNLLPERLRAAAMKHLVDDIEQGQSNEWPYPQRNGTISTGFIGCKHINLALTEGGRSDVAYRLLTNEAYPSWLFPVKNGATTIWERWDGWTPQRGFQTPQMNSFNHYGLGAIGEWMYSTIAGIDLDAAGFRKIRIRPIPGGGLTHAAGRLETPYGLVECRWHLEGDRFSMSVTVPPNTTAAIRIPARSAADVTEGGLPVGSTEGLRSVHAEDGAVVCQAVSGSYDFISRM